MGHDSGRNVPPEDVSDGQVFAVNDEADDVTEPVCLPSRRLGRYELLLPLGEGGMAAVYLARLGGEDGFERLVAVKQVHPEFTGDPEFEAMLFDEARLAAGLHHPNLVQVTDLGTDEDQPYVVMEFVNGETLGSLQEACHDRGERLPYSMAAHIVAQACQGLHHAHELCTNSGTPQNLVHRDVTPQNILISYDGAVRVTDFGIAKAVHRATITERGNVKGKISYLSPEQIQDKPVDRRSDVFTLGIVLYEATLDCRLFEGDTDVRVLRHILSGPIPRPTTLDPRYPVALEAIVMKALSRPRGLRYATARDLERDLNGYLSLVGRSVGSPELSDLMERHFADRKHERAILLSQRSCTEEASATVMAPAVPPGWDRSGPRLAIISGFLGTQRKGRRWQTWLVAAALALVLLGGAVALGLRWSQQPPTAGVSPPKALPPVEPDRAALPFSAQAPEELDEAKRTEQSPSSHQRLCPPHAAGPATEESPPGEPRER